jgi:hypothetical protein
LAALASRLVQQLGKPVRDSVECGKRVVVAPDGQYPERLGVAEKLDGSDRVVALDVFEIGA